MPTVFVPPTIAKDRFEEGHLQPVLRRAVLDASCPRCKQNKTPKASSHIGVIQHGTDRDEPTHRVPDQHTAAHFEVLENRGVITAHGSGSSAVDPIVERPWPR